MTAADFGCPDRVTVSAPMAPRIRRFTRAVVCLALVGTVLALVPAPVRAEVPRAVLERRTPTVGSATAPSVVHDDHPSHRRTAADQPHVIAAETGLEPFSMIGATIAGRADEILVRTVRDGAWSEWTTLELSEDEGPDRGSAEATEALPDLSSEPIWVGEADGYEISAPAGAGQIFVDLVREEIEEVLVEPQAGALGGAPAIRPRANWGARPPKTTPFVAGDMQMAVIHHSAGSNAYSASQVPGIIRGIQAYHMDTHGWDDIGYNFVVDRFGGMWEGRAGGIDKAVVGAHAAGFNTYSTGVVVLGDFTSTNPTDPSVGAVADVLAWKFAQHRLNPSGWVDFNTVGSSSRPPGRHRLPRIISHRDVGTTGCPGDQLYARLSSIRSGVSARFGGQLEQMPAIPITGDFDGNGTSDTMFYRQGSSPDEMWYGDRAGGFRRVPMPVHGVYRPLAGDFDGDGASDILWHGPGSDLDSVMYGQRGGGFSKRELNIPSAHQPFAGDFNGDGVDDFMWYGPGLNPDKWYYGTRTSSFIGKDVDIATTYVPIVGDLNGDGRSDILWYTPNSGPDRYWYGRSEAGSFSRPGASPVISGSYEPVVGNYNGDAYDDIFWFGYGREADSFWWGTSTEAGLVSQSVIATTVGSPTALDVANDGADDILWYAPGRPGDPYWRIAPGGAIIGTHTLMINGVYLQAHGDYNGDGREDFLWWTPGGQSHVWYGKPDGDFERVRVA